MSEQIKYKQAKPMGPKIAKIRRLEGLTQEEFGMLLGGRTVAYVSRLEQSETIENDILKQVCDILKVTEDGLKNFDEESTIYLTANFFDNCSLQGSAANAPNSTFVYNSIEDILKLCEKYESKIEKLKDEGNKE